MASTISVASVVCISLALICGIASFATTSWMNGCILFDDIITAMKHLVDHETFQTVESQLSQLKGSTICYSSGIFLVSVEMPAYHVSKSTRFVPNQSDQFLHAVSGLLITAVILFIVSLVFLGLSTCSKSANYERKVTAKSYNRIAVGILVVGCVLYGAGMATYTVEQSKVVHNYKGYIIQIGPSFSALTGGGSVPGLGGFGGNSLGRKRRQADISDSVTPMLNNFNDFNDFNSNMPISDSENNMSDNSDLVARANKALEAFKKMDPVYGYSFYVAWAGLVFAILALVFAVLACRVDSPTYDSQPLPVL